MNLAHPFESRRFTATIRNVCVFGFLLGLFTVYSFLIASAGFKEVVLIAGALSALVLLGFGVHTLCSPSSFSSRPRHPARW